MPTNKKISIILIIVALISIVIGISFYFTGSPKTYHITVIGKTSSNFIEYWNVIKSGISAGAKDFNVDYDYIAPDNEEDVDVQIRLINDTIEKKPDGIILVSTDYEKTKDVVQKAINSGIPLVCLDSDTNVEEKTLVSTDNVDAGRKAGEELLRLMDSDKKVLVVSHNPYTSTAVDRESGFKTGFGIENSNRILSTIYSYSYKDKAFDETYKALKQRDDIGGIVGLNEPSTVGAATAVKFLGLSDKIKIVGFDSSIQEIKMLEEGTISAMVVQKPFNMGYLAIKAIKDKIELKKLPANIYTETVLVTKDNMFENENQKLIFIFME